MPSELPLTNSRPTGHNLSSEVTMLAYIFVLIAVAVRFMPHPWTFTPVAAALLYFGARGSRRQLWVPLALLAASDVVLTKFVYGYSFSWDHFVTWAWYAAILWLGANLRKNTGLHEAKDWARVGVASLASSVSFFVASNFAVWACWNMYPKTFSGLMTCYTAALPFFRHGVEGDLLFTALMFALPAAVALVASSKSRSAIAA